MLHVTNTSHTYDIDQGLNALEKSTNEYNSTFDKAKKLFSDVEERIAAANAGDEYRYPTDLVLNPWSNGPSYPPQIYNLPNQPFNQTSYELSYSGRRLQLRTVTTTCIYSRDWQGNIIYSAYNVPMIKILREDLGDPKPVADCSRELRIMVIQNLPSFIEYVRCTIEDETEKLKNALKYRF